MSKAGKVSTTYKKDGSPKYSIEIWHEELGKRKETSNKNRRVLESQAAELMQKWDRKWDQQVKARQADAQTQKAKEALRAVEELLAHTLNVNHAIDFGGLHDTSTFAVRKPQRPTPPKKGFLTSVIAAKQQKYEIDLDRLKNEYQRRLIQWQQEKQRFSAEQASKNMQVDEFERRYRSTDPQAVVSYCELVLRRSRYPSAFPKQFEVDYSPENHVLVVDYELPAPGDIPTLESVTYVKSTDEFRVKHTAKSAHERLYDEVIYQIAIRTIHELYDADQAGGLESVVFNGFVNSKDPATGAQIAPCILSVQANKGEFESLVLENIDPKAAFKRLKGVGSSQLHILAPVAPIMRFDKSDSRFVEPYAVAGDLTEQDNIAAMDWEDFEHLIREVFEEEFASHGGEVKITQASRDRGVDAIAFDPDPIRGGKTVIQAKRYTNTVGVEAVRDLYGTVINEGAGKGILVTTSDFGPDAYQFAKGKPLVLLNGGNLLHLLAKHGHTARIDTTEAKRILAERERAKRD